jgi:hypothetical protein
MHRWIKPAGDSTDPGYSWETTPAGRERMTGVVYKATVVPHPLTTGGQNSFPDPDFMHSGGKPGKTAIQRTIWLVN